MTQVTVRSHSRQWWLLMAWRQAGHQKTFITVGDIACVDFIRSRRCNVGRWLLMLGVHLITRGPMGLFHTVHSINHWCKLASRYQPMRKKLSRWVHGELTVSSPWAHHDHGGHGTGPNDHGSVVGQVTAQSRQGHSSVTARSQLSHGEVTAQSRHPQYDHGSVTARSQLNHGPGHGSVMAGCDHFGHGELTVSSLWAHGEQSRWPIFFSWEYLINMNICKKMACYHSGPWKLWKIFSS